MPAVDSNALLLRAVQRATRTLARTDDINVLLKDVLEICVKAVGAQGGTIYVHDPAKKCLRFEHVLPEHVADIIQFRDMPDDEGVAGQVFQTRHTLIGQSAKKDISTETGVVVKSMITVPLMMEEEEPIGVVQLINKQVGEFNDEDVTVLDTVAAVSTMAYLNSRLVEESTRASTLLGMGKVGHDIGNLASSLFATHALGEYILDSIASDGSGTPMLGQLRETSGDLKRSIARIVGYSRLISDLSAGRSLRPEKEPGNLAVTIAEAASYLENDARKNCVALKYDVADNAPEMNRDELFVFRIVQNLVGNAIKAVRETISDSQIAEDAVLGSVTVAYRFDNGHIIEVTDTGAGMTPEVAEMILGGKAKSKWKTGGSGWGTKIVNELAASHDGVVEIDSTIGKGSTFRVRFPA